MVRQAKFFLPFPARREKIGKWWSGDLIESLLEPLHIAGCLQQATHFAVDDAKPKTIKDYAALLGMAAGWKKGSIWIYRGERDDPAWAFILRLDTSRPSLGLFVLSTEAKAVRTHLCDWLVHWTCLFSNAGCDLSAGYMQPPPVPYPRPRPPREGTVIPLGYTELYLGQAYHQRTDNDARIIHALQAAPLEPMMRRVVNESFTSIGFDCDLDSDDDIARARRLSESWLTPMVPSRLERGWNDFGDRLVIVNNTRELAPFTIFDTDGHAGYFTLTVDPDDGSVDEARWKQMAEIATSKRVGGQPVSSVRIVVPVRENAVSINARALAAGFDMVVYPAGQHAFWQVHSDDGILQGR